jgi:hypothetical protein
LSNVEQANEMRSQELDGIERRTSDLMCELDLRLFRATAELDCDDPVGLRDEEPGQLGHAQSPSLLVIVRATIEQEQQPGRCDDDLLVQVDMEQVVL